MLQKMINEKIKQKTLFNTHILDTPQAIYTHQAGKWMMTYGKTSMIDRRPKTGLILYSVNPASLNSLHHSFSSLCMPGVTIEISRSNNCWVPWHVAWEQDPITMSMMITFPPASLEGIASLHRFRMFTQSLSLQSCSTNCNQQCHCNLKCIKFTCLLPNIFKLTKKMS